MIDSLTIRPSITPDSAYKLESLNFKCLNAFPGLRTKPLIPSSEINKFEPEPIKYAGIELLYAKRNIMLRSSLSLGVMYASAGPPIP